MFVSVFDTNSHTADELGGKGYGLWWMQQNGINVPPALIIPTTVCGMYQADSKGTMEKIKKQLSFVYGFFQEKFGYMPLLSIRSGARVSMPGMMDTVLNVGLHPDNSGDWSKRLGKKCLADCLERFQKMFGSVVRGTSLDLTEPLPPVQDQILDSIEAVFKSWNNERAQIYRKMNNIPDDLGTAVVIQAMVFGNLGQDSGTGVLFTRNPDTGEDEVTGEYLPNAQGEDVVAGTVTPHKLSYLTKNHPELAAELLKTVEILEEKRRDVQDVEFTIQQGKLYILQTRNAKRSAKAAIKIALDMVKSKMITKEEAFQRVSAKEYYLAQQPILDPKFKGEASFVGIPACSGVVTGIVVRSASAAINCKKPCILVTEETTPDDIGGMIAAQGILTMKGGSTSHAAVVARSMNRTCVVGLTTNIAAFPEGHEISIDGSTGKVWLSKVPIIEAKSSELLKEFNALMFEHLGAVQAATEFVAPIMLLDMTQMLVLPPEVLVEKVQEILKKTTKLVLDVRIPEDPRWKAYYTMFNMVAKKSLIKQLGAELTAAEKKKVIVIGPYVEGNKLSMVTQVSTLHELVMVSGEFLFDGAMDAAMQKVMKWKESEGCKQITVGGKGSGTNYLSVAQAVNLLLA